MTGPKSSPAHPVHATRIERTEPDTSRLVRLTLDAAPTDRDLGDAQSVAAWFIATYKPYLANGAPTFAYEGISWKLTHGLVRQLSGYELCEHAQTVQYRCAEFVARRALAHITHFVTLADNVHHVLQLVALDGAL